MLSKAVQRKISAHYKVDLSHASISSLGGGDVNVAYKIRTAQESFVLKKIQLNVYAKEYQASLDDIVSSLYFIESICRNLSIQGNVSTAVEVLGDPFLILKDAAYILYPFIEGKILENENITCNMVSLIAKKLYQLHHCPQIYDKEFSEKKFRLYKEIGLSALQHPHLKKIHTILNIIPLLKRLNRILTFFNDNQSRFQQAVKNMSCETVCHNDLKPKNVLWTTPELFWIIDWEAASDFDHKVDYLDTLLAWSVEAKNKILDINLSKVLAFQKEYFIEPRILRDAVYVVLLKWLFWFYFCLSKTLKHPYRILHYRYHASLALDYMELIIGKRELNFLSKGDEKNAPD
ncbi:TPA: phosphotransferase [Legionella pneumophila]|nr:phosphotransferase [Legionella pneumophila]HEH5982276.1 phosphotransferase [Legionella pneumophila]HEM7022398.1 phosphotransferase [Legionella pneumophila]HEM7247585.1 phosphotransferase [Legionella pneumophila]HEO1343148.1 phosphotransferase [Legionella pneumophila]